jgi:hypothetical protein
MIRSLFRHRCTIERDAADEDEFGAEVAADWQPHLEEQPCRFWMVRPQGEIENVSSSRTVAVEEIQLAVPAGTDVTTADRIAVVTNRLGTTLMDGPLRIDSVTVKSKFLQLSLRSGT